MGLSLSVAVCRGTGLLGLKGFGMDGDIDDLMLSRSIRNNAWGRNHDERHLHQVKLIGIANLSGRNENTIPSFLILKSTYQTRPFPLDQVMARILPD